MFLLFAAGIHALPSKMKPMDELMRILVAESSREVREALRQALAEKSFAVYEAEDGEKLVARIGSLTPDAVVMSIALSGRDGLGVLEHLREHNMACYPFIVVVTGMGEAIQARSMQLGADAAMAKPPDIEALSRLLVSFQDKGLSRFALRHADLRIPQAENQLHEIGVLKTLKGFSYLARAVALVSVDMRILRQATGFLYPHIAREAGVTDHSVERAIRHAIESTWTRGSVDALHRIFGNSIDPQRGKPTNSECIAMLSERLRETIMR